MIDRLSGARRALLSLLLAALGLAGGGCTGKAAAPNLLLITIDTLRADHLGCYGYFRDTSPTIDSLAGESVFFERCIVPMATTLPSHTSLLTGTYPIEHGVLANVKRGGYRFTPSPILRSYAEIARDAGYRTAAVVSGAPLNDETGIEAGFDRFEQPEKTETIAEVTNKKVFRLLDDLEEESFFLWVHYYDPHFPYKPPKAYRNTFQTDDGLDRYMTERRFARNIALPTGEKTPIASWINEYDGEIRYLDDQIAVLIDTLRGRGMLKNTVIVLTADHGEGVGQHGRTGHSFTWEEQLLSPLMILVPGEKPRKVTETISLVDALPTLFALTPGLPRGDFASQASGRNAVGADFTPEPVLSQDCAIQRHDPEPANYTLTTKKWKLRYEPEGTDKLFDLENDPYELDDAAGRFPDTLAAMKHTLLTILAKQEKTGERYRAAAGDTLQQFDPAMREKLKGLGYLN